MPQWVVFTFIILLVVFAFLSNFSGAASHAPANTQPSVSAQGIPSQASGPGSGPPKNKVTVNIGGPANTQPQTSTQAQSNNTQPQNPAPAAPQPTPNNAAVSGQAVAVPNTGAPAASGTTGTAHPPITDKPVIDVNSKGMPVILIQYVVQPGDTLSSIAQRYHSSINLIMQQNGTGIPDPNHLVPGQVIYVPDP